MKKRLLLASTTLACITILHSAGFAKTENVYADNLYANTLHDSAGTHSDGMHEHKKMQIPTGQLVPSVDLIVHPDAIKGWNLEVKVSNFKFAPENINKKSNSKEGHAHLYINGKKLTRLYGSWYYLASLGAGFNKITVTLNANGHEELVHNGQLIEDTEIIEIPVKNN